MRGFLVRSGHLKEGGGKTHWFNMKVFGVMHCTTEKTK